MRLGRCAREAAVSLRGRNEAGGRAGSRLVSPRPAGVEVPLEGGEAGLAVRLGSKDSAAEGTPRPAEGQASVKAGGRRDSAPRRPTTHVDADPRAAISGDTVPWTVREARAAERPAWTAAWRTVGAAVTY